MIAFKWEGRSECFYKGAWGIVWGFRKRGKVLPQAVHAPACRKGLPESGGGMGACGHNSKNHRNEQEEKKRQDMRQRVEV